jgi:hypothetical protein
MDYLLWILLVILVGLWLYGVTHCEDGEEE